MSSHTKMVLFIGLMSAFSSAIGKGRCFAFVDGSATFVRYSNTGIVSTDNVELVDVDGNYDFDIESSTPPIVSQSLLRIDSHAESFTEIRLSSVLI